MNRKQITYLIIFIAVLLIAIVGVTYAFFEFGSVTIEGNLPINTATGSSATFTAYSEGNISLDVNKTVMSKDVSSTTPASTDNSTIHVKLEGGSGTSSTTCTYDLIWAWDSEEQYKTSTVELPYTHTDGTIYPYEFSVKIGTKETNLSDFTWNENKAIIATKSISALSGETKTDDYDVIVNFYNLPIRQNDLSGKLYQGHIEVSEARCNANPTIAVVAKEGDLLADSIKALYIEDGANDLFLHDGVGTYTNANLEAGDNSYRYAGANPNNYVCFGDDCSNYDNLYRIIGVFDDRVKLIKADYANSNLLAENGSYVRTNDEGISFYLWNINDTNDWENSELNKTNLNNNFINNISSDYLEYISSADWIVSGIDWLEILKENNNAKIVYNNEIAEKCEDCTSKAPIVTYNARIGLMYLSDYMYAASPFYWSKRGYTGNLDNKDSILDYRSTLNNNWLNLGGREYAISKVTTYPTHASDITDGRIGAWDVNDVEANVRPSFYLKSSVVYKSGVGTKDNPIIIGAQTLSNHIIASYSEDGSGDLYLHDGKGTYTNANLEANDNSYRYAGANPNNYVCFGSDAENCPYDNLYRIIGIFDGKTKLVKADFANSNLLGTDGDYNSVNGWNISEFTDYRGKLSEVSSYYRNYKNYDETFTNTNKYNVWSYSALNRENLNINYVNNIGTLYSNMIDETAWHTNTINNPSYLVTNAKSIYEHEMGLNGVSVEKKEYNAKIGLMYISDYMYGAKPDYWSYVGYDNRTGTNFSTDIESNDYRNSINDNWIFLGFHEWLITECYGAEYSAYIYSTGAILGGLLGDFRGVRPTFYLNTDVKFYEGTGTEADPMRIGL